MPYEVAEFNDIPNPNAVKCWLYRPISDRPQSLATADPATGNAVLKEAL